MTYYPFPTYEKELRYIFVPVNCGVDPCPGGEWVLTDTIVRKTYAAAGQLIATHVSGDTESGNNGLFYLHSDHLGSSTFLTHGNGHTSEGLKVANSTKLFTPFGEYRINPPNPPTDITDRGFTGHKHNDDIGLIYMNARYYLPSVGRFVSADTIIPYPADPQSHNRFSYVRNNPLNSKDPTGHFDCMDPDVPCVPVIAEDAEPSGVCLEVYCEAELPLQAGVKVKGSIQNDVSLGRKIFSTTLNIGTLFLDVMELNASLTGMEAQALAAIGGTPVGATVIAWLAERFGADFAETILSSVTLMNTIAADIVGGNTYFDSETNEIVLGQSTILGLGEVGADLAVPGSPEFDVLQNTFMLIYDIVDIIGAPNFVEYRIPIHGLPQPRLFFGEGYFVIYDFL